MAAISLSPVSRLPWLAALLSLATAAWAGSTDISNQPLASLPNLTGSPNLLLLLDSSGSMNWSYMPDDLGTGGSTTDLPHDTWYGYYSPQCNGLAYDPTHTYTPPVKADGTSYSDATFTAAWDDGYVGSTGTTTDLSSKYYFIYKGSQPTMGWTYTTSGVTKNDFYNECATKLPSPVASSSVFTLVKTSSLTATQKTNYANWYSYYSHRYLLMRTAMGLAMQTLNPKGTSASPGYRVGFSNIYDTAAKDGTNYFVSVSDFTATQMDKFYSSLYAVKPNGGTPLPNALSQAGRYFANKISGQSADPMQYACQRNYTLLTTDGYWNANDNALQLDGKTKVDNQDGGEVKPMWDGSSTATTTTTTLWSAPATRTSTVTGQTSTKTWTVRGTQTVVQNATVTTITRSGNTYTKKVQPVLVTTTTPTTQTYVETLTQTTTTPQTATASYTETVVVVNGVQQSDSNGSTSYSTWVSGTPTTTQTGDTGAPSLPSTSTTYTSEWLGSGTGWTPDGSSTKSASTSSTANNGTATTTNSSTAPSGSCTYQNSPANAACTVVGTTVSTKWTYAVSGPTQSSWTAGATSTSTPSVGTYSAGTPTSTTVYTGGSSNSLSDVAEYYYKTDLRTSDLGNCTSTQSGTTQDVCANTVPTTSDDPAKYQHMNTFTIGLGVNGTLPKTADTLAGLTAGTITWPVATSSGAATNIDDLWHAALNGRGQYYSALNADQLASAINSVVNNITAVKGAGSGSSTSSLALVKGDNNQIYTASYTTSEWTGELIAQTLNGDGTIKSTVWSAQGLLDSRDASTRAIYFNSNGALTAFTYANLTAAGLSTNFDNLCSKTVVASQCATLTSTNLTLANNGTNLVDYLRGVRTNEGTLYRTRAHVLGDIVNGAPVYVGKPPFSYSDSGYSDFVTSNASRTPVVYTAGNDGMLHAFNATTGAELWAFVPTAVMPNLYQLANRTYSEKHQFFVDGAPVEADVKWGGTWKTILVGGFNAGGKGYYALDITNPTSPTVLWEFTDTNMGLSYGNPVITKNKAGTWVVVFSSGYNNTGGDGNGHLFVVNAQTGAKILDIPTYTTGTTPAGSTSTPSGLSKINAWIDSPSDNTALRFYGGDLLGNVWRFDTDSLVSPNKAALRLATLKDKSGNAQPVTTRPETVSIKGRAAVAVATGRYLGSTDITDTSLQTLYVIADNLDTVSGWAGWSPLNPRTNTTAFVEGVATVSGSTYTIAPKSSTAVIDFTNTAFGGWYMDLPNSGERVFTDMVLHGLTLTMTTAIPSGDACKSGGSSWIYYINLGTVTGSATLWSLSSLIVGVSEITNANGDVLDIFNGSDGTVGVRTPPVSPTTLSGVTTRTSWRELGN